MSKMEEKFCRSEERYRTLVEKMNEGVVMINEHRVITYANEKMCHILGSERNQIVGRTFAGFFEETNLAEVEREWGRRQAGKAGTYGITGCRIDGSRFHVMVSATPIFDEKGVFRGSSAVVTDITEQKRAEGLLRKVRDDLEQKVRERTADLEAANHRLTEEIEERKRVEKALRVSERSLRHIYDHSPVMMHSIDENGIYCKVNRTWLQSTGYRREEVIGQPVHFLIPPEEAERALSRLLSCFRHNRRFRNIPFQFIKKDGSRMDVLIDSEVTEDPSGSRISLSVVRDVTEQNRVQRESWEARRLLRTVVDGISDPLVMVDRHMKIRILNAAALRYYGLSGYAASIGHFCMEVLKGENSLCRRCAVPSAVAEARFVSFERKGLFNAERIEQVALYPVEEVADGLSGGIIRITDITEKKKVEEQLIRADRLSSLGQLSAGIAHEIRNPLSGISLFIDILSDPVRFARTGQEQEILEEIKTNISRINQIIKRVLDFARHGDSAAKEIDINGLLHGILLLWYARMRNRNVRHELHFADNLPPVLGDMIGIQQVMNNLIQNAIDAMTGGGRLILSTAKGSSEFHRDKTAIIITVADTGTGMDTRTGDRIFDPFFTTKSGGTGLGLSISHQIMERQGGFITFRSEPGKGTVFTVELPAVQEENR